MLLQFYDDVGAAIKQTSKIKYDDEAILLSKDARNYALSTELGNSIWLAFDKENVVVPTTLRSVVFTTAAVDNIVNNRTSTTASTDRCMTRPFPFSAPNIGNEGVERLTIPIDITSSKSET
ncbi:Hypothetical predicted protein [Mytilus galloprovincialis]|uniref:Uncharacterized protein n=1 Tax=Mytilus galloprovincialis TaxID=29158 RepID=A0A8B6GR99_MYTGA|nr:Hypothetical predicted protein [Mytilus galloprovincialis]